MTDTGVTPTVGQLTSNLLDEGVAGDILGVVYGVIGGVSGVIQSLIASGSGIAEQIRQESFLAQRPALLDPTTSVELLRRDFITNEQAHNTLSRGGYTDAAIEAFLRIVDNLLPVNELRELYRRDLIGEDELVARLAPHGLRPEDARSIAATTEVLLGVRDLIELWRRDEIDDFDLADGLSRLGYSEASIQQIFKLALLVPAPQDVIRFLAREVYSPDLRAALNLDEDFPTGSLPAFRAAGLSEEFARDLWAAHWVLPSLTDTYRLFWRGLIDRDGIEAVLRANDVLPQFREALVQAAYRVPTRVDARRFHALDLITEEELHSIYVRQGFSPDDADLMVRFTVAYNTAPDAEDTKELRQLTRTQIEKLYRESVLDRDTALLALQSIDYSEADSDTILSLIDLQEAEDVRDVQLRTIRRRYEIGATTYNEAIDELAQLDLSAVYRDRILVELEAERRGRIHLPTRSELDKLYGAGLIEIGEYQSELERLGWPAYWAGKWAQLNTETTVDGLDTDQAFSDIFENLRNGDNG